MGGRCPYHLSEDRDQFALLTPCWVCSFGWAPTTTETLHFSLLHLGAGSGSPQTRCSFKTKHKNKVLQPQLLHKILRLAEIPETWLLSDRRGSPSHRSATAPMQPWISSDSSEAVALKTPFGQSSLCVEQDNQYTQCMYWIEFTGLPMYVAMVTGFTSSHATPLFSRAEVHIKIESNSWEFIWDRSWAWEKPLVVDKLCRQRDCDAEPMLIVTEMTLNPRGKPGFGS